MATSKPSVCSNTFSLNTRSCACSRYFCKTAHSLSMIFWAFKILELQLVCMVNCSREGKLFQAVALFSLLRAWLYHWVNITGMLVNKTELNMWHSMLYLVSTLLLLLAVQNYKPELSILPICENQSANLKAEMKGHGQHDNLIYLLFSLRNCTCPGSCIVCDWIWGSLYDRKTFQVKLQTVHYTRWESAVFTQYLYISAVTERFYYWQSMNFGKHPWELFTLGALLADTAPFKLHLSEQSQPTHHCSWYKVYWLSYVHVHHGKQSPSSTPVSHLLKNHFINMCTIIFGSGKTKWLYKEFWSLMTELQKHTWYKQPQ